MNNDKKNNRVEAYLRSSCADNSFRIPDEFENWRIYYFSRSSCLREWQEWLSKKLRGKNPSITTDMTPSKELERKIRERREALGKKKNNFQIIEEKIKNLKPSYEPKKKLIEIEAPSGTEGSEHHVM